MRVCTYPFILPALFELDICASEECEEGFFAFDGVGYHCIYACVRIHGMSEGRYTHACCMLLRSVRFVEVKGLLIGSGIEREGIERIPDV